MLLPYGDAGYRLWRQYKGEERVGDTPRLVTRIYHFRSREHRDSGFMLTVILIITLPCYNKVACGQLAAQSGNGVSSKTDPVPSTFRVRTVRSGPQHPVDARPEDQDVRDYQNYRSPLPGAFLD